MRRLTYIHRKHTLLLAVSMLFCSHVAVHAQVPDSVGVGQLQRQFTVKPQPQSKPPVLRERPQSKPLLIPNNGKTFLVKAITFDPTTTIPVATLQERASIFLNQPVTTADVYLIAAALTDYIREQGYLVSRVIVPKQGMENGVIRFEIIEQGIADVVFQGDTRLTNASIIKNIRERLLADVPLQRATLEQALLTLNRLSGVSAEAVLFSVSENQSGLKITLAQKRIEGIASIDNRGSNYVGPWQGSIGSTLNGVLTPFDQLSVRGISATDNQEMRGTDSNYQVPLNSLGTALKLSYARVWSEPGYTLRSSRLENVSSTYGIAIKHPLIQERSRTISIPLSNKKLTF